MTESCNHDSSSLCSDWINAWKAEFLFRWGQDFSLLYVVQTGSEAHPASYSWVLGVKRPGSEADHSLPYRAEVKNTWIYTSTPPYVFMV
jgi:hypothetical protein